MWVLRLLRSTGRGTGRDRTVGRRTRVLYESTKCGLLRHRDWWWCCYSRSLSKHSYTPVPRAPIFRWLSWQWFVGICAQLQANLSARPKPKPKRQLARCLNTATTTTAVRATAPAATAAAPATATAATVATSSYYQRLLPLGKCNPGRGCSCCSSDASHTPFIFHSLPDCFVNKCRKRLLGGEGGGSCLLQVHLPAKANAIFSLNVGLVVVAAFRALYTPRSRLTSPPALPHLLQQSPHTHLHIEAAQRGDGTTFGCVYCTWLQANAKVLFRIYPKIVDQRN